MKKALIYIVSLLVIGGAVNVVYHNPGVNVNSILAIVLIVFFGIVGSISAWRNKTVPNYERAACFLSALSIAAFVKALSYQLDGVTFLDWVALLVLAAGIILVIIPADNADADETKPLPDVDDDDVTVVCGEEAVVTELEFPEGATLLVLDENGNPELDEYGCLQFYDDEGHRIYGVSALGTVTKITDDSIVITKEDGNTITVNCDGSVEGDIPDSPYVPSPDNKVGWRSVYQGIRERLKERPDEDK